MKLYAYCVTRANAQPPHGTTGLFDRKTYVVGAGEISAVVSDVADEPVVVSKASVLTHQNVIASLLGETTPLPFRFGTVVGEPELTSYLVSRKQALLEKLASVDGCVEMSVKIIWQEAAARCEDDSKESAASGSTGTEFLRKKQSELSVGKQLVDKANDIEAWLKSCLGSVVNDIRTTVRPSQRLVLAADCLVSRLGVDEYNLAVEAARSQRPDLHFLTSGPWAPYSFVNIDLEFKSHFGVS